MTSRLFLVGTLLLAVACGHTETHHALFRAPGAKGSGPVELYLAAQASPKRPYYEIALVQAVGFGTEGNAEEVVRALTGKAAELGCDAVIRVYVDVGYSRAHAAGVCVKFTGPGDPAPPAALPPPAGPNPSPPPVRPAPAPRIEPLPSAPPRGGGGR